MYTRIQSNALFPICIWRSTVQNPPSLRYKRMNTLFISSLSFCTSLSLQIWDPQFKGPPRGLGSGKMYILNKIKILTSTGLNRKTRISRQSFYSRLMRQSYRFAHSSPGFDFWQNGSIPTQNREELGYIWSRTVNKLASFSIRWFNF